MNIFGMCGNHETQNKATTEAGMRPLEAHSSPKRCHTSDTAMKAHIEQIQRFHHIKLHFQPKNTVFLMRETL